jgi:hypothetical protein
LAEHETNHLRALQIVIFVVRRGTIQVRLEYELTGIMLRFWLEFL